MIYVRRMHILGQQEMAMCPTGVESPSPLSLSGNEFNWFARTQEGQERRFWFWFGSWYGLDDLEEGSLFKARSLT